MTIAVQGNEWFGYNPPFIGGQQNVLSKQIGIRLIKNDVLQLLLTLPGERVHRPRFGTTLRALPFESMSESTLDSVRRNIIDALDAEEPRLSITSVILRAAPEEHMVTIHVLGTLTNAPTTEFKLEFSLSNG